MKTPISFLNSLGYATGDRVYVRAIPPKKTPSEELQRRGMAFTPEGEDKIVPLPISGYLTLDGFDAEFTRVFKSGSTKTHVMGLKALERFNKQGYGIYFIVNPGGDADADIVEARSLFYECDDATKDEQWQRLSQLEQATGARFTVIETHKSLHCYGHIWPHITDSGEWQKLQQRLIQLQDSDPAIDNPARLMRLPGFLHWRWDGEQLLSTPVVLRQQGTPVELDAITGMLPPWDAARWGVTKKQGIDLYQECVTPSGDDPWNILNFAPLLDGYNPGARRGWITCKCPAHNGESDNSLHINESTGAFKCHSGCDSPTVYQAALDQAKGRGYTLPAGKRGKGFAIPKGQRLTGATKQVNTRWVSDFMADVDLQGVKILAIKSPQNTGKTTWLDDYINPLQDAEIPLWMFTYRHALELGYGARFTLPTRSEMADFRESLAITGGTLCIHSARKDSAAQFDGSTAPVGPVILDEVRGILNDLVDSALVRRGKVIPEFTTFLQRCSAAGYPIVLLDAHLTDAELMAIASIVEAQPGEIVAIENTYQPWAGRQVYTAPAPALTIELRQFIGGDNGPVFITTSSQKPGSSYGSHSLERICRSASPTKTVLRVDRETIKQEGHPAANFMKLLEAGSKEQVNDFLSQYAVVIVSPVIEAGWSLELFGHFKAQFSFIQGNLPAENVIQQVLRLRDPKCPIYAAMPQMGRGMATALKRGNGSSDVPHLRRGELTRQKGNLHQLLAPSTEGAGINAALLDYWFTAAARQNDSIGTYQQLLEAYLSTMGCEVAPLDDCADLDTQKEEAKALKQSALIDLQERAIEQGVAESITDGEADKLKEQRYNTPEQLRSLEKHGLEKRYQCEVTPGLALLDALCPEFRGQAQLLFYTTIGRDALKPEEQAQLNRMADDGAIFTPDLNKRLSGYKIHVLEALGIKALMDRAGDEIANDAPELQAIGQAIEQYRDNTVELTMGIKLDDQWGTVRRINHLCKTLFGLPLLKRSKTRGKRGEQRTVIYTVLPLVPPDPGEVPTGLANGEVDPTDTEAIAALADAYRAFLLHHWHHAAVPQTTPEVAPV